MYCHLQVFLRHATIFSNINVQTIVFWMIYFQKAQPTHDGIAIDFKIAVSSWRCRVWLSHDNAGDISWWCWYLSVLARNLRHDLCTQCHRLPIEKLSCMEVRSAPQPVRCRVLSFCIFCREISFATNACLNSCTKAGQVKVLNQDCQILDLRVRFYAVVCPLAV